MTRIFGREVAPDHPLEAKLAPLDAAQDSVQFIAENWRYDWRVSAEREAVLLGHACTPGSPSELSDCYRAYYKARICRRDSCEYHGTGNIGNRIIGLLDSKQSLCRAIRLNGFYGAAREALLLSTVDQASWLRWLGDRIGAEQAARDESGLRALLARLFTAWNEWPEREDRPMWASPWSDVEPLLATPDWPDRVRDALGLGTCGSGEWLAILRYPASGAGICYRPTSLDADWQPWHVPSPPSQPYGYTLDLSPVGGALCPEVLHRPQALDIAHWTRHIGRTRTAVRSGEYDIRALRRRFFDLANSRFPHAGRPWSP